MTVFQMFDFGRSFTLDSAVELIALPQNP